MTKNNFGCLYKRKERFFFLYRMYLFEDHLSDLNDVLNGLEYGFTKEQKNFINKILDNIEFLENKILEHIKNNWSWDRFNYIEKSILLNATAEIIIAKNKKSIVINESIEFAKKYCDKKSESLINGILDKINS